MPSLAHLVPVGGGLQLREGGIESAQGALLGSGGGVVELGEQTGHLLLGAGDLVLALLGAGAGGFPEPLGDVVGGDVDLLAEHGGGHG